MKNVNILKKTLQFTLICFCITLGSTSAYAQNGLQPGKQEIERLRSLSRNLSGILPNESAVNGSNAFTPAEKANFQFIRKTIALGTQIPDNPMKESFLNFKSQLAKVFELLLSNPPNPNPSAKSSTTMPGKSFFDKLQNNAGRTPEERCKDDCQTDYQKEKLDCALYQQGLANIQECQINAGEKCLGCMLKCQPAVKH